MLECVRRLLLASVIGMVPADSAAAPTLGLIIALVFIFVFVDFKVQSLVLWLGSPVKR